MAKLCETTSLPLAVSAQNVPGPNEWVIGRKVDGAFNQQIVVQLSSADALKSLIMNIHGCGIKVGGRNLVVEVRSLHPDASSAALSANNLIVSWSPGKRLS